MCTTGESVASNEAGCRGCYLLGQSTSSLGQKSMVLSVVVKMFCCICLTLFDINLIYTCVYIHIHVWYVICWYYVLWILYYLDYSRTYICCLKPIPSKLYFCWNYEKHLDKAQYFHSQSVAVGQLRSICILHPSCWHGMSWLSTALTSCDEVFFLQDSILPVTVNAISDTRFGRLQKVTSESVAFDIQKAVWPPNSAKRSACYSWLEHIYCAIKVIKTTFVSISPRHLLMFQRVRNLFFAGWAMVPRLKGVIWESFIADQFGNLNQWTSICVAPFPL